jgi:hypothetical protein
METYSAPTNLSFQQIADHKIFPRKNEINVKPKKLKAIASSKTMQKPTHGTVGTYPSDTKLPVPVFISKSEHRSNPNPV